MITAEQASSPECWRAVEDSRGKLWQLKLELPSLVCSSREDSQAHYLGGRTTLVREKKLDMLEADPGTNCNTSAQQTNHKTPVYVPEFMGT